MKPRRPPGPPPKRPAAIYTRVSTTSGLHQEVTSLDMQREACRTRIAQEPSWTALPDSYDDGGFTGANTDRPAFQRLVADIRAGHVKVVVAYKLDRICRSFTDFARLVEMCDEHDVVLVSVTQNFNTGDIMGRLLRNLLAIFAEFERELIVERTRDKIAASRKQGKWTGGLVPLGYDSVDGKLVVNESEATVVREIFALYLEHRSVLTVVRTLTVRARMPKVRGASGPPRWSKDMVLRVLRCCVYAGVLASGEEMFKGDHDAIVDRATYDEVQTLLERHAGRPPTAGRNPEFLLSGRLRCAACDGAMTPASTKKGNRTYRFYRCVTRDKLGRDACTTRPLAAAAIEGYVVERLRLVRATGGYADEVAQGVAERVAVERAALTAESARIPRASERLQGECDSLLAALGATTGATRQRTEARLAEASREVEGLHQRLREVQRQLFALREAEADSRWVASVLDDFDGLWAAMTPDNRRRLLAALIEAVIVDDRASTMTIRFAEPCLETARAEVCA